MRFLSPVVVLALSLSACAHQAAAPAPTATSTNGVNRAAVKFHTKVTEKAIEIDEKIQFELGMATILPASDTLLAEIVDDLRQHPEIAELHIEGHASSDGSPESNLELSQKRADAVKKWLVEHGVEDARLSAKGYGQNRPIASNDTEEGREKNRRVEFNIVKRK